MSRPTSSSLWDWSLTTYDLPEVKDILLIMQDRHGYDVSTLLWAMWAAEAGHLLPDHTVGDILTTITELNHRVVQSLRSVRRYLRVPKPGIDSEQQMALRQTVMKTELNTEKLILLTLERKTLETVPSEQESPLNSLEIARRYFTLCGEYLETPGHLSDEGGPDGPSATFERLLKSVFWGEGTS